MLHGPLHPIIGEGVVAARHAELLRYRREIRLGRSLPRRPSPGRERLGWFLVETGLRLAVPGQRAGGNGSH